MYKSKFNNVLATNNISKQKTYLILEISNFSVCGLSECDFSILADILRSTLDKLAIRRAMEELGSH